jgi:hypothetical protein
VCDHDDLTVAAAQRLVTRACSGREAKTEADGVQTTMRPQAGDQKLIRFRLAAGMKPPLRRRGSSFLHLRK